MKHDVNAKSEKQFNDHGAMNNNLDAATIQMNPDIAKQHIKPKVENPRREKNDHTKML